MDGPHRAGTWIAGDLHESRDFSQWLKLGQRYQVIQPFKDYDGDVHPVGEPWTFLGYSFLPYDDGLSLFVTLDDLHEWPIRLLWRLTEHEPIIEAFAGYIPWRYFGLRSVALDLHQPLHWVVLLGIGAGTVLLAICILEFARSGRGTLSPIDPPRKEEPALRGQFGAAYERYAAAVGRWLPRLRPWPGT